MAIRSVYTALQSTTPLAAVVQHNPQSDFLNVEPCFGLYSHRQVAASDDDQGVLFGPTRKQYEPVAREIKAIFAHSMPLSSVLETCRKYGIDVLVVKVSDPIWNDRTAPIWTLPFLVKNDLACALSVGGDQSIRRISRAGPIAYSNETRLDRDRSSCLNEQAARR